MATASGAIAGGEAELRRSVTIWGSYAWGYADVGADIYVALGLVMGIAMGYANIAFTFAGIVYVCIGLAYTELAAAYPVAGGGQFFVNRALGDFMGFIAGWAVLLDFTIDIALFAWFTIGYISFLIPWLGDHHIVYFILVLGVTGFLTALNAIGVKQSSRLNEIVGLIDVCTETFILVCGFTLVWHPEILIHTMQQHAPSTDDLLKGISLAIISFVGLESISHAAEETQRPASVMPRSSVALILTILIFALAYSNLALGMTAVDPSSGQIVPMYQYVGSPDHNDKAVAVLASQIPVVGVFFALYVPIIGALLVLISSNSGVFGASRIAYSMGKFRLLPSFFQQTHPKTQTPLNSILIFSGFAVILLFAAFFQGAGALNFLADLYAFGAALSYTLVFVALIVLRFTDTAAPRRFRMPWNIPMTIAGKRGDVSLLSVIGLLGIFAILVFTLMTHVYGRIAGPTWVILGVIGYIIYRKRNRAPILGSIRRDWVKLHEKTLTSAGELEMLDEYRESVTRQAREARGEA
ncbi:MAG TPA: APC family permease [Candidatus Eremiobacteraceae bacterium]|nr:APC family permease [Candidatus Eremiobacteraceae bacterium]